MRNEPIVLIYRAMPWVMFALGFAYITFEIFGAEEHRFDGGAIRIWLVTVVGMAAIAWAFRMMIRAGDDKRFGDWAFILVIVFPALMYAGEYILTHLVHEPGWYPGKTFVEIFSEFGGPIAIIFAVTIIGSVALRFARSRSR